MKALIRAARWTLPFLGFAPAAAPAAGPISPSAAPVSWVRYAETVTTAITAWLEAEDQDATSLRAGLAADAQPDHQHPPLILSLWIDGSRLSRVDFASSGNATVDADLRSFLIGRRFDAAAPKDMRQPMRIAVQLRNDDAGVQSGEGSPPDGNVTR